MAEESAKKVREIRVIVDTKGAPDLRNLAKEFDRTSKSIKNVDDNLSKLKNAFSVLSGISFLGFGVREFTEIIDTTQKLGDRLAIISGSAKEGEKAFKGLAQIADITNSSVTDIADSYARLAIPLRSLNLSTEAQLEFTQGLVQSFRLSGSNAQEAANATVQLAQGLALGTLRGQDLKSVLSQNAIFGEILAKELGITTAQVYKFSESGKILNSTVLKGIAKALPQLNEQAKQLTPTIGESLTKAMNKLKIGLDEVNKSAGISRGFGQFITFLTDNLPQLGFLITALALTQLPALIASIERLSAASLAFAVANPIVATLTLISGAVILATDDFGAFVGSFESAIARLNQAITGPVAGITSILSGAAELYRGYSAGFADFFKDIDSGAQGFYKSQQTVIDSFNNGEKSSKRLKDSVKSTGGALAKEAAGIVVVANAHKDYAAIFGELNQKYLERKISLVEYTKQLKATRIEELKQQFKEGDVKTLDEYNKKLNEIKFGKPMKEIDVFKKRVASLNDEFEKNGSIAAYARGFEAIELAKFNSQLDKGTKNILEINKSMRDRTLLEYNRQLQEGTISLQSYNNQVRELKLLNLDEQLKAGTITQREYNKELQATSDKFLPGSPLQTGLQDYIESAGTLAQGVSGVVSGVFSNLENALVEFTKNGKFAFKDFANAVIEDINRVIIRSLIVRPLAEGILNFASAGSSVGASTGNASTTASGSQYANYSAKGNVFDRGNLEKFASGGVVNRATSFGMSNGRQGLMGEKGPEAIIPLKRGKNGDLGVQAGASGGSNVMVNITNNSGGEVEQKETTNSNGDKVLDILIHAKVKEGFATGVYDRQMSQQYGLRRRGN